MTPIESFNEQGRARHQCPKCGHITAPILATSADKVLCRCHRQPPGAERPVVKHSPTFIDPSLAIVKEGPGTELKNLLAELGITGPQGCGCESKAQRMNRWGVEGCRERFETIRGWLVESRGKATWAETIRAGMAVVVRGINFTDIESELVRIAIERAERKAHDPARSPTMGP